MLHLARGQFVARLAETPGDMAAVQALRQKTFRPQSQGRAGDRDCFDDICTHVVVELIATGQILCCFRLLPLENGTVIGRSYSAQFYDLAALTSYKGRMAEMGRFCVAPEVASDPDILRVAWGGVTRFVDAGRIEMLFGCSSFAGTQADCHAKAFALLAQRHLAPASLRPKVKAPDVVRFVQTSTEPRHAMSALPPLLRSYLQMGGWVSDHAVVDHDLNTLHVFTGLEIAAIPPARAKVLRAIARGEVNELSAQRHAL